MEPIFFQSFPLAPSANALYNNRRAYGQRGRKITQEYKDYLYRVDIWRAQHFITLKSVKLEIDQWFKDGYFLQVDCTFMFPKSKIWAKNGQPKVLDSSNFIKATHDALSNKILYVDDRYFWYGTFNKAVAEEGKECAVIKISPIKPLGYQMELSRQMVVDSMSSA